MKKKISVITPCFNEELNVKTCYETVRSIFEKSLADYDYEHIFSDNASVDDTVPILRALAAQDTRLKVIRNSRNFGPFRSNFNALLQASGDAIVVFLPADLQDPPELIPDFVKKWEEGYEVVYGMRDKREEFFLMVWIRKGYYRMVNRLASIHVPKDAGEFQLIDKKVLDALKQFDDYYPYIRGMIASCGFRNTGVKYTWKYRKKGFSKNSIYNLLDQALNGIISLTNIPLRVCMLFGFLLSSLSILYAFVQFIINIIWYRQFSQPGIPTLIVAIFFFSGVQLLFIGILGEYISAIHSQVRKKPLVIESERINF